MEWILFNVVLTCKGDGHQLAYSLHIDICHPELGNHIIFPLATWGGSFKCKLNLRITLLSASMFSPKLPESPL